MSEIEFRSDVPVFDGRSPALRSFAEAVRQRPRKWGKLPRSSRKVASNTANNINLNRVKSLPAAEFEARYFEGECWVRLRETDHPVE